MWWLVLTVLLGSTSHTDAGSTFDWLFGFGPEITDEPSQTVVEEFEELRLHPTIIRASFVTWYKKTENGNWDALPKEQQEALHRKKAVVGDQGTYRLTATGLFGSVDSKEMSVVVNANPNKLKILSNPADFLQLEPNQAVTLSVLAVSSYPLIYQWRVNGQIVPGNNANSYVVKNLPFAGSYFVKCEVCTLSTCLNSTASRIVSLNEFTSVWPTEYHVSETALVMIKATRPFPDRADTSVKCLFRQKMENNAVSSTPFIDDNGYVIYDENDIPTVFCSLDRQASQIGEYQVAVYFQDTPSVISGQKTLSIFDSLQTRFHEATVEVAWHSPTFNFLVDGSFDMFPQNREIYGFMKDAYEDDEDPAKVKCGFVSATRLNCESERKLYDYGKVRLSFNGLSYSPISGVLRVVVGGKQSDSDVFTSLQPRSGPLEGGTLVEISGNDFSYSGQTMYCIFEDPHGLESIRVAAEMLQSSITCRTPAWKYEDIVVVKLDIGDVRSIPVIPPFAFVEAPSKVEAYPKYLPELGIVSPLKPIFDYLDLDTGLFTSLAQGFSEYFTKKRIGTRSQAEKLSIFFIRGQNFRKGTLPYVQLSGLSRSPAEKQYPVECSVLSSTEMLCRLLENAEPAPYTLHVSFDNFNSESTTELVVFGAKSLIELRPDPPTASLVNTDNRIALRSTANPHTLFNGQGSSPQINIHVDTFTLKSGRCSVSDPYFISCHLPRATTQMSDQDLSLSISVGGSSARYLIRQPLSFFRGPVIVSVEPSVLSGYGGQPVIVTFDREIPAGVPLDIQLILSNGDRIRQLNLQELSPSKFTFPLPMITSVVSSGTFTAFLNSEPVTSSQPQLIFNTVLDRFSPSVVSMEDGHFSLIGHHMNEELLSQTKLRISDCSGNLLSELTPISCCNTRIDFHQPKLSERNQMNLKASISFDNGTSFWTIKCPVSFNSPDYSDVELEHIVSPAGDGSSALILRAPFIPRRSSDRPTVRLSPIRSLGGKNDDVNGQEIDCILADENAIMCLILTPLFENQAIEVALDGQSYNQVPRKYLQPTNMQ